MKNYAFQKSGCFQFIFICNVGECKICKVGGLDLSRRDLDRDLDLDAKKKSVSTVEIFSTVWKTTSRQSRFSRQFKNQVSTVSTTLKIEISRFLSRSRRQKKVSLDSRDFLDSLKNDISMCRDISISISIGLDCRDPQP